MQHDRMLPFTVGTARYSRGSSSPGVGRFVRVVYPLYTGTHVMGDKLRGIKFGSICSTVLLGLRIKPVSVRYYLELELDHFEVQQSTSWNYRLIG